MAHKFPVPLYGGPHAVRLVHQPGALKASRKESLNTCLLPWVFIAKHSKPEHIMLHSQSLSANTVTQYK
jgi:hypothetical protein